LPPAPPTIRQGCNQYIINPLRADVRSLLIPVQPSRHAHAAHVAHLSRLCDGTGFNPQILWRLAIIGSGKRTDKQRQTTTALNNNNKERKETAPEQRALNHGELIGGGDAFGSIGALRQVEGACLIFKYCKRASFWIDWACP